MLFLLSLRPVLADTNCDNRYAVLVNPVRSRDLWFNKSLLPLNSQYQLVEQYKLAATWLIQFDVLRDKELLEKIKSFDKNQEIGIFLEVSEKLTEQSRVIYPHDVSWFNPNAVFLSGYSQSDRKKIIDNQFKSFKIIFGFYPKSIGAWWIDSYSLGYMREKYGIKSALIVADQKTTDNYGVWGQWWGVPYYPLKVNILTPASSLDNKLDVVIIQWAQRDPILAYGDGPKYSNYSLQANDYIRQGKNTKYFEDLANIYLDCKNPLGQITVGLETGTESVGYINEYANQLKYLSTHKTLEVVTMSQFADKFSRVFPNFTEKFLIGPDWILKTDERSNHKLKDNIKYNQSITFKDYFISDKENFLDRNLEKLNRKNLQYQPYYLVAIAMVGLVLCFKKHFKLWMLGTLFATLSFGLLLKSSYQMGWQVYYGSVVPYLEIVQVIIILISYLFWWLISKTRFSQKNSLVLLFIPLSFGLDFIVQNLRYSFINGQHYFGFALDNLRFLGISFSEPFNLEFVKRDFSSVISASLLRFNFSKIWDNLYLSIIVYPLTHVILGILLGYIMMKIPSRVKIVIITIFVIVMILQVINIFQADPRLVQ